MKKIYLILEGIFIVALLLTGCGKSGDYKKAMSMYENGQYREAATKFTELGDFENSKEMVKICHYETAKALFDEGSYEEAKKAFLELGDFKDSADYAKNCDYNMATALFDTGDYEAAIAIYETIDNYKDSAKKMKTANRKLMKANYGDVFDALDGNTWFFNGGLDTILNAVTFAGEGATITQFYYSDNGKQNNGSHTSFFSIDDKNIIIPKADNSELTISYTFSDGTLSLGENEYFSIDDVEAGIQGYWTCRYSIPVLGIYTEEEYNVYFNNGKVVNENAALAYGSTSGEYHYYGPDEGSYTIDSNGLVVDLGSAEGSATAEELGYGFNIIDGKVAVLMFRYVFTPSDKLPGRNGYKF